MADTAVQTCAELAEKLAPGRLPDIRDRALKALSSKLEVGLLPAKAALDTPGVPQLLLHWLNDRQDAAPVPLLSAALRLIAQLARHNAVRLQEAGCVAFLQDFRPQVPTECLQSLDNALWALLSHGEEAHIVETPRRQELWERQVPDGETMFTPPKMLAPRSWEPVLKIPLTECSDLCKADQQLLLDLSVRLKFAEAPQRRSACRELAELAVDMPPTLLLAFPPLVEGLALSLREETAAEALCVLLERLEEISQPLDLFGTKPRNWLEELPALGHLMAQLLSAGPSLASQHALRTLSGFLPGVESKQQELLARLGVTAEAAKLRAVATELPGGPLASPGYLPMLLALLTPAMWQPPGAAQSLVARFPDEDQLDLLEQVLDLLRASSTGCQRRVDSGRFQEFLPQFQELLRLKLWPALRVALQEGPPNAAHGRLATDGALRRAAELLLRISLALQLGMPEDGPLLSTLMLAPAPLPRLALTLALGGDCRGTDGFEEALLEHLARGGVSWRRSGELRAAVWLAADLDPAAVAYVTPYLQHVDAVVQASAWRCLRRLLFRKEKEEDLRQRNACVQRALRALRALDEGSEAFLVAEVLEVLRCSVEATGNEACRQTFESGIMRSDGLVAKCLAVEDLGLRRAALRLLGALLAADYQQAAPNIFKAGLWTLAVAAVPRSKACLDVCSLTTDLVVLLKQGTGEDGQLLFWICSTTPFLERWAEALQVLEASSGERVGRLLLAQMACLRHFIELQPQEDIPLSPLDHFLCSPPVGAALGRALDAEMPPETQQVATAAVAVWAARRMSGARKDIYASDATLGRRVMARLLRLASDGAVAECVSAANLFAASAAAAEAGLRKLEELCSLMTRLKKQQQLVWVMRVFFSMMCSSLVALEGALSAGLLSSALLTLRAAADRDEAVCLEFLEQLPYLASAEEVQAELLQSELLSWLMRLSLKRELSSAAFCRVMDTLCLCSGVLAGKQVLVRYLGQIMEVLLRLAKGPASDHWRTRKLTAAMNFIASLRLCSRSAALLTGTPSGDAGTRRPFSAPLCSGLDLWFDLSEERGVRCAALQLLLNVATNDTAQAKAGVEAWPRLASTLQSRCGRRITLREGILQRLAKVDLHAGELCPEPAEDVNGERGNALA
ncbi:unnamed protein product [Effrenium voratum]|uniref:Rotatin N-terminal domain-containing protein n=1 Tax=Effrenium voratum TaxID=2562239 RepID=A0AA36J3T1_9DINO|nr:unnamed protein product [Effrenium voratum]CAJ1460934.1 unnamed protein product [Effrenium voratum]